MSDPEPKDDDTLWERGWDGHRDAQRRRLAALPFVERLAWLEEAQRVVEALRRQPDRPDPPAR